MDKEAKTAARLIWNEERAELKKTDPWWPMPAWGKAAAWRKRPYLREAENEAKNER